MARMDLVVQIGDLDRFRLFVWELRQLQDEMRVMASPHTERLERLIDRFADGGPLDLDRPRENV